MTVQEFCETFIKENVGKTVETGITTLDIYDGTTRKEPIAFIKYSKRGNLLVRKPTILKKIYLKDSEKEKILKAQIKRIGNGTIFTLDIII